MTGDEFTKAVLALLSWREERSNGINGQTAVMLVVRNRVKAGWSGGDWLKVMASHNQFSSLTVKGDPETVLYPDPREPAFQQVLQIVDSVHDGTLEDRLTDGSLYYADLASTGFNKDGWFAKTILANPTKFPRLAQVGSTTYFGEVK